MSTALTSLNDTFDTSSKDVTIQLIINKDNFTSSNLQGSDLVIITNPNLRDGSADYIDTGPGGEREALEGFVDTGGSVLYMGNPFTRNSSIAGHKLALDALTFDNAGGNLRLGLDDADNTSIVIDDFNNDGNSSHVYFSNENILYDIWATETNEISRVLYYGASIERSRVERYANGTELTYAVTPNYDIIAEDNGDVTWFVGNSIGQNDGRSIVIGSTIMFSDLSYNDETAWIDVEDNNLLFQNIVAWLLKITPLNLPEETVDSGFGYFLRRNILLSILIPVGLIALIFGILLKNNIITVDKIIEFRTKRREVKKAKITKKTAKAKKKTTKKAGKKATKKRRKRN
jgi:hypothetical protein